MNFGSDNQSGASDQVLEGLVNAPVVPKPPTPMTTGLRWRNTVCLRCSKRTCRCSSWPVARPPMVLRCRRWLSHGTPLSARSAHIAVDESTAPEWFTGGARLQTVPAMGGKISPETLDHALTGTSLSRPHSLIPSALSLTQCTESGRVYSRSELADLCQIAHSHGLGVHMDGARFANAVAATGATPADLTWGAGVDVLSLGATKNGAMALEAVICFDPDLARDMDLRRKRTGHLVSKGRLFGAQMCAWLDGGHWLELAKLSNHQARALERVLCFHPDIELAFPVEANEVFVTMPTPLFAFLQSKGVVAFDWPSTEFDRDRDRVLTRWVTSFETTLDEINQLADLLEAAVQSQLS